MTVGYLRLVRLAGLATSLTACLELPRESSTTQGLAEANKLGANKLGANKLGANKLGANKLGANKLGANKLGANKLGADVLLATADGREVMSYLVSCGLPAGLVLVAEVDGVTYEFPGEIGLAPRWADHPLRPTERGWISACMIARINKYEVSVPISMRGPHDALAVTDAEAAAYTAQEAAFYGDIFTPGDEPIVWIACRGQDQASGEHGQLVDRDCAEQDTAHPGTTQCGFTYAGDCADWAAPRTPYACKRFVEPDDCGDDGDGGRDDDGDNAGGYYAQCHDRPGNGRWHGATKYDQVITVYVTP